MYTYMTVINKVRQRIAILSTIVVVGSNPALGKVLHLFKNRDAGGLDNQ